jgi:phospholipid/cholesterol/gamma-HCH transport system substrate-binding protein
MKREIKVGLFIVCTAIIICLALLYLAQEKGFFTRHDTFTLASRSGDGFTEGMPVEFSGFTIGKVQKLELNNKGIVLIKIKIPQKHVKWIRKDSTFTLYRSLIGTARVVVTTDNLNSEPLPEGKIPEVQTVNDINDSIEKVQPLLDKITQIAENLERVSAKVDIMVGKADVHVFGSDGTMPQFNKILKDVNGKLEKLNPTVDNINKISTEASEGLKDIGILRSNLDDTLNAVEDLAKGVDSIISTKKEPEIKLP